MCAVLRENTIYIIQPNFAFTQVNVVRGNGVCILVVVD